MATKKRKSGRILMVAVLVLTPTLIGAGAFALVRSFLNSPAGQPKKIVQEIKIIRPPPPPPDLPPPPPPPPDEKVDIPDPEQQPDPTPSNEPPPGEQLGLDAEGGAGGDAFGLLGRKGGRDLLASGGAALNWYGTHVANDIRNCLADDKEASKSTARFQLWQRGDGSIEHVKLAGSTGNADLDRRLEAKISGCPISQAPPEGTPQPITLRLASRS